MERSLVSSVLLCGFYGAGIIGMLLVYGLLQERIITGDYQGERFGTSVFLVFMNRVAAVVFAVVMALINREGLWNVAPLWTYLAISVSNVYSSTCQYEALKYVSFPVQMLGKSFKMMPVMLWGLAVGGKSYKLQDWIIAGAITGGVTEFLMTGPISSSSSTGTSFYGLGLLAAFLLLDGFTSTYQEVLFKEYKTSKYNQMIWVNLGSCVVSSVTIAVSGGFSKAFGFIGRHPAFLVDASVLSASAVGGQWFIYSQVKEFGALVFAATMNVRQVNSILVSYATYGHSITALQMLGLIAVFGALFFKSAMGFMSSDHGSESEKKPLVENQQAEETAVPSPTPAAHEKV